VSQHTAAVGQSSVLDKELAQTFGQVGSNERDKDVEEEVVHDGNIQEVLGEGVGPERPEAATRVNLHLGSPLAAENV